MTEARARAIAFYLPQFHPIPENDEWWGAGFTEWTNAARARPLFRGHVQPHLPADLGFYDLRMPDARQAQSDLAVAHGVEAFCYWHYWFGAGSRILERPFAEVLAAGSPAVKFCLGWANQTWTGIWHGAPNRVLREQTYPGPEDDRAHFESILPALRDDRYLRVDGRPVFYVFRPEELPDARAFVDRWQQMAKDAGLGGMYLVAEVSDLLGQGMRYTRTAEDGFDAGVYVRLPAQRDRAAMLRMKVRRKLGGPEVYPYATDRALWDVVREHAVLQPSVYPNWDNTPRSGSRGTVLTGSTPERFAANVEHAVETLVDRPADERLLWIKSWNEWAEGNYLEPDLEHGRDWLTALSTRLRP
ncbi:glycosyltransferase WbsX family protein [Demequina muriae]|uniref:Glycoside hydrolase family 99-like domain-containing protein n=1 Tax=Demequina muriae TaxID=3051664 RepID=A0ABT8GJY6_9MICO|nr:glycoside hydrolase family 99-like domain-containing protein [Demequina sp. EGI L300058]MDN4481750.1 glycoside hydrolase family 99-like domain-containing protein [Demequina sp. EGI L300058]